MARDLAFEWLTGSSIEEPRRVLATANAGTAGNVVFVHGVSFSAEFWIPQLARLPESLSGHAIDLLGHGARRVPPPTQVTDEFVNLVVEDAVAQFDALGSGPCVVVGANFGGVVVLEIANRRPERVSGVVVIASATALTSAGSGFNRAIGAATRNGSALFGRPTANDLRQRLQRIHYAGRSGELEQILYPHLSWSTRHGWGDFFGAVMSQMASERTRADCRRGIESVTQPVLVLLGEDDPRTPRESVVAGSLPPNVSIEWVAECGHQPEIEQPDQIARRIERFVDTLT
jgi:pimeloyl-ACP methyl ester carboxylesterase